MKMKIGIACVAALMSSGAFAQGMAGPTTDWTGFYAGLSYGEASGEDNFYFGAAPDSGPYPMEGDITSAFVGYNVQRGQLVYGGELSLGFGKVRGVPGGYETQQYDDPIDLKARVGYSFGGALVYGVLGYSQADFAIDGQIKSTMSGMSYGVGVDYMVNQDFFVGVEYLSRELNGDLVPSPGFTLEESGFDTISVRVGMKF